MSEQIKKFKNTKYGDLTDKVMFKKNKVIEKKYKEQKILETKQKSNNDYGLAFKGIKK